MDLAARSVRRGRRVSRGGAAVAGIADLCGWHPHPPRGSDSRLQASPRDAIRKQCDVTADFVPAVRATLTSSAQSLFGR
jgi:hypothetical protein